MATDRKTVVFCSDLYTATIASNTTTAITMPTLYLPESSKVFKTVVAHVFWSDVVTATGSSYTVREVALGLGGGAKQTTTNTNTLTNSGENIDGYFAQYIGTIGFQAAWSGTSMTCQVDVRFTLSGGTFTGVTNVCVMLEIDYEYDDTSATQIKTIYYQLPTPDTTLATSKPASLMTVPAFDTLLPEASKTYRGKWVMVGGNRGAPVLDASISVEMQSGGAATTALFKNALASSSCFGVILKPTWDTSTTQTWHIWGSQAYFNHPYCYAIVTYEFDASAANDVYHSLILPASATAPFQDGSANVMPVETEFWIGEDGPITAALTGIIFFWAQIASATNNLRWRANTADGFTSPTDAAGVVAGSVAGQHIGTPYVLTQGRNKLRAEAYVNLYIQSGGLFSAVWIVNYVAPKMTGGHGAHTKTRITTRQATGTGAAASRYRDSSTEAFFAIPQADYFLSHVGLWNRLVIIGSGVLVGFSYLVESLAGERGGLGVGWVEAYNESAGFSDAEVGTNHLTADVGRIFNRWPSDPGQPRLAIETGRRSLWQTSSAQAGWNSAHAYVTYHTHTWTVNATIKGSAGGTVTVSLHRQATGEKVLETTRSGDGAVSLTWYDNTELVFLVARDGTNTNRKFTTEAFLADSGVTHTLRLFHPRGPVVDVIPLGGPK
jgi:hypothetical protein